MQPDITEFHKSVSSELNALKDRVRHLIGSAHWPTDGSYKEILLRRVLKRNLPDTVRCGTGFVYFKNGPSKQLDVLIIDARRPRLFEEGDLYVVSPDCVVAAIEVKTATSQIEKAVTNMAEFGERCRNEHSSTQCWTGVFAYEEDTKIQYKSVLENLQKNTWSGQPVNSWNNLRAVNCVAAGPTKFFRYWDRVIEQGVPHSLCGDQFWHAYELKDLAPAYLIGNILQAISTRHNLTFPEEFYFPVKNGKEASRMECMSLNGEEHHTY